MFLLLIIIVTCLVTASQMKEQYVLTLTDVDWNITTTNNYDMEWKITRVSRGIYGLSGFFDYKEDINTDNAYVTFTVYYSPNGISYVLSPFQYPRSLLTEGLNFIYKDYVMEGLEQCCDYAVVFKGTFHSPLKKHRSVCTNCFLSSQNFPSHMRAGYYKFVVVFEGELGFALMLLVKLELE